MTARAGHLPGAGVALSLEPLAWCLAEAVMNTTFGLAKAMTSAEAALMATEVETIMTSLGWPLSDLESNDLVLIPRGMLEHCRECGVWSLADDGSASFDQGGQP